MAQQFTLTIKSVEVCQRAEFGPHYSWQSGEHYEIYLNVTAIDHNGNIVYFNSPAITMSVASAGGVAVVTYGKANAFISPGSDYVVTKENTNSAKTSQAKINVGDTIVVQARIKKMYANGAYSLNYVKFPK